MTTATKKALDLPTTFRIKREVQAHLASLVRGPRSRGFHPSEMPRLCPVKFWYYDQALEDLASPDSVKVAAAFDTIRVILNTEHDGVSPNRIPARLDMDLFIGSEIHRMVQFVLGLRGYLWGGWECVWCHAQTDVGFMPTVETLDVNSKPIQTAAPCTSCKGQNLRENLVRWNYVEPFAGSLAWWQDGHTDGLLIKPYKGETVRAVVEIKSINENGYYEKYGGPLPKVEHVQQASQYVFNVRQLHPSFADVNHVYFVYVNKNALRDWKEFLVEADPNIIARMQHKMQQVLTAKQKGEAPTHARLCESIDNVHARSCPIVEPCFGCKPPANFFDSGSMKDMPL